MILLRKSRDRFYLFQSFLDEYKLNQQFIDITGHAPNEKPKEEFDERIINKLLELAEGWFVFDVVVPVQGSRYLEVSEFELDK